MGNNVTGKSFLPIAVVFILVSLFIWLAGPLLEAWKVDRMVIAGGNTLLFLVTLISFSLYSKALRSANMHAFVRVMYGSLLIKMLVCLIATFIYASMAGRAVNRNGVIGCFIFYILYTFFEVKILMELTRKQGKSDNA